MFLSGWQLSVSLFVYMDLDLTTFLVFVLATFRLSSLLAKEDGPGDLLIKLRMRLGTRYDEYSVEVPTNNLTQGITCMWCNSIWIAALITLSLYLFPVITFWCLLPFALSAGAVVLEGQYGKS